MYLEMTECSPTSRPNPDKLPAYYRMDLNVNKIISEKLDVSLNVKNLLNRKNYVPSLIGADGYAEPGMSVLLRAGYKF